MDWKKSKNILILALILTNLALFAMTGGFQKLMDGNREEDPLLPSVISMLSNRGIGVNAELPPNFKSIYAVDLEYNEVNTLALASQFLGADYEKREDLFMGSDGSLFLVALEREMRFEKPKHLWASVEPLDEALAWQAAEAFLQTNGFDHADRIPWRYSVETDHVVLEWRQFYGAYFLEEAFIRVRLTGDQVVSFERRWFNEPQPQENVHKVIQPSKALFLAAEEIAASGSDQPVKIESITLGYKLETGSLTTGITSGEASPYWRVRLSDERVIFVEAVEG